MEKLIVLLVAVVLVVLGARGTYKPLWNAFFPGEPIVTTPTPMPGVLNLTQAANQAAANPTYNPVAAGQQAGTQARNALNQLLTGGTNQATTKPNSLATGTTKTSSGQTVTTGGGVYPVESIGTTKQTVISTGVPDWWPSWLPYPAFLPHGPAQTGQVVNNPYAP